MRIQAPGLSIIRGGGGELKVITTGQELLKGFHCFQRGGGMPA